MARPGFRRACLAIGVLALVIAAIALVAGTTKVTFGGVVVRNSSVLRPLVIAGIALALAQAWRVAFTWAPVALLLLLPLGAARETLIAGARPAHPMRTLRDCARPLVDAGRVVGGAYTVSEGSVPHIYAFYTLPMGPWTATTTLDAAFPGHALDDPARPQILILSGRAYSDLALQRLRNGQTMPPGISAHRNIVVLLPGPLGACAADVIRAGARPVGGPFGGVS
jgi:hypothetical protein